MHLDNTALFIHRKFRYFLVKRKIWLSTSILLWTICFLFGFSFSNYITQSEGEPLSVIGATWARDHGLGSLVATAEDVYYTNFKTVDKGGVPKNSVEIEPQLSSSPKTEYSIKHDIQTDHLSPPQNIVTPASETLPGEGIWQPVGSTVDGTPALYATRVRPDATYTSQLASLLWIDTKLTQAMFIPGYQEPAGSPNPYNGALPTEYQKQLLANFNGAFRLADSQGGYYYEGTEVAPLQNDIASTVIYKDGSIKIGIWNTDVQMTSQVSTVRQNLHLIVNDGISQVEDSNNFDWGATTHGENLAWRSAIGQRKDGSIIYVGSPGLSASSLAETLVRAGVYKAMILDMNDWWVAGFYFTHEPNGTPICHKLEPDIAEGCDRFLQEYKRDSFQFLAKNNTQVGDETKMP